MSWLFGHGWPRVALVALALVVVVGGATTGAVLATSGGAPKRHASAAPLHCGGGVAKITETGTGTVSITPNLLTLSLDVHTTAPQASAALAENDKATAGILHALSAGGVTPRSASIRRSSTPSKSFTTRKSRA